jgi:hypothetical protein
MTIVNTELFTFRNVLIVGIMAVLFVWLVNTGLQFVGLSALKSTGPLEVNP